MSLPTPPASPSVSSSSCSLRVLSWNVDMDTKPVTARMNALVRHVHHLKPDVICLQELTKLSHSVVRKALCDHPPKQASDSDTESAPPPLRYTMHCDSDWPEDLPYFCAMLTRHNLFENNYVTKSECTRFPTSNMLRGYVHVAAPLASSSCKVSLVTSHLESLEQGSACRKEQLEELLDLQRDMIEDGYCTIFAGDTNLREKEVSAKLIQKKAPPAKTADADRPRKKTKTLPKFQDAWVVNGENAEEKFSWDMLKNDNLTGFENFKPRARYDRAFILGPEHLQMCVPRFQLVGQQRTECSKFISDHWGLFFIVSFSDEQAD